MAATASRNQICDGSISTFLGFISVYLCTKFDAFIIKCTILMIILVTTPLWMYLHKMDSSSLSATTTDRMLPLDLHMVSKWPVFLHLWHITSLAVHCSHPWGERPYLKHTLIAWLSIMDGLSFPYVGFPYCALDDSVLHLLYVSRFLIITTNSGIFVSLQHHFVKLD